MGAQIPLPHIYSPSKGKCWTVVQLIDIDNCLVDSRPLNKYIPSDIFSREGWDKYQKHYNECIPNPFVIQLVLQRMCIDGAMPIFVTAREDRGDCRKITEKLLTSIVGGAHNYRLFMRDNNDFDPDVVVKSKIYDKIMANIKPDKIIYAIDDKPEICELWQSKGIQTLCYKLPKIVTQNKDGFFKI